MTNPELDQKVWGLDVSHYQETVQWAQVAQKGYKFAFIKATEGCAWTDPKFHTNWNGAKAASLMRGAYHYYEPGRDPQQQAEHFLSTVWPEGGQPLLATGDLPPVLDVETTGGRSAEEVVREIHRWLSLVQQRTLRVPILYTNRDFWDGLGTSQFGGYPLWVAEYGVAAPSPLPAGWRQWSFWQFSQTGRIGGIRGEVDLDLFRGSLQDLQQMASSLSMPWI
ncbi:MAG TPA: GH25 family lysozyme [Thermoanaerobaculia bacterium]|nr:GH25 family lysozyme [Thermoanaerobaculia bacterium]